MALQSTVWSIFMSNYKHEFIELAIRSEVLKFGSFTLKSGRVSPYFFNAGNFYSGEATAALGRLYAEAIVAAEIEFDLLFGPAYKGISLAAVTAAALYERHDLAVDWCYNRKEKKDHGEGGQMVGAPLQGRVMVIDDVITAGTAIRESVEIIKQSDASLVGVSVALDRAERGQHALSAIQEVQQDLGVPVVTLVTLTDVLDYLQDKPEMQDHLQQISDYRSEFGVFESV